MIKAPFAIAAAAAVGLSLAQAALGQSDDGKLGTVHFETSCKPDGRNYSIAECSFNIRFGTARPKEYLRMR